jgi:hypothetical protein
MGAVTFKPVKRVTTMVGYSITNVDGKTPLFSYLQPGGSLQYNYHLPLANFTFDLGHNLGWNAGWNYYQYNEKSFVGPATPRYVHANNPTLSGRLRPPLFFAECLEHRCVTYVTPAGEVTHCSRAHPARTIGVQLDSG